MMTRRTTLSTLAFLLCTAASQAFAQEIPAFAKDISAGTIAAISDGEFFGRTYYDRRLTPAEAGLRDILTILSISDGRITKAELSVSNSVTAAPEILELMPDGRTAFVVERLGQRPAGGKTIDDLPPGTRLFAIDLADKSAPRIAATAEVGAFPEALGVSPDGRRVAVVSNTPEASLLQIVDYAKGGFGEVSSFNLADLGITGQASTPRGGVTATNVNWHPSGRFMAVNITTQDRVAFFEIVTENGKVSVKPWGEPVAVGRDPFVGRFTPDGRFYLTSDWGRDFAATTLDGRIPTKPGAVSVIRIADPEASSAEARHEKIGSTETDRSAEGIAISPDGRFVATVNMRDTAFPPDSGRFDRDGTVTLLSFDPSSGALAKIRNYPFEGVLPEGGTFDLTGDHFLASVFHGHTGVTPQAGAGIEVFRVVKGDSPALQRLGRIPLAHGVHHVDVSR
jgi:hypothetical protein